MTTEENKALTMPVAIVAAALIIGGALFFSGGVSRKDNGSTGNNNQGAKLSKFQECLQDQTLAQKVSSDQADGRKIGVNGTPSFAFVMADGSATAIESGALPYDQFKPLVEKAINGTAPKTTADKAPAPVTDADHILGDKNAPVSVIVYTDLECPFCRRFHQESLKQMMDEYGKTGKVKLVYRHFPLPATMHPNAQKFAMGAECVVKLGNQDKFWEYLDNLFTTEATDPEVVAKTIGVVK